MRPAVPRDHRAPLKKLYYAAGPSFEAAARRLGIAHMKIISQIFRPHPKVIYLEPFFGCNYNCRFCIHGSGRKIQSAQLDPDLFDNLKPLIENVKHVHMTGLGEPFLNPYLSGYLTYFRDRNKSYYLNTNGSLIEDTHIDLMTASQSELSVSLDAGDRETYEKIRRRGDWDKVLSLLKKVSQVKTERKSLYPLVYLTFHVNGLNLMSLKKVPELGVETGVDAVRFSWTILPEADRAHSIFWRRDAVNQVLRSVGEQLEKAGINVRSEAHSGEHVRGCWNESDIAFVGANGAVAACCSRWITIGHLRENSFQDIWNGMPRRKIALAVLNRTPEGLCRHCPQIRGVNYEVNEEDFLKSEDLETKIVEEKVKRIRKLPSLTGLAAGFGAGATALIEGNPLRAVDILSALDAKFPDYFEIKNNLAAAHFYLGNYGQCAELLHAIERTPHNNSILQSNLKSLRRVLGAA